jgi:aspartate aminotransferase
MEALASRLAPNLRATRHSETLLANQVCARLQREKRPVYRLGFGQSPFPVPASVVAALRAAADRKEYLDVQGLPALREAVARFHSARQRTSWNPERVVVGAGSKILLYALLAAVERADVALVTPGWVSYEPQALLAGHRVYRLHTRYEERWRLTAEQLADFCEQRSDQARPLFLVLNYPGNPDGLSYTASQLASLAAVMARHQVIVISDEIYGLLHHRGEHRSIADLYPEGTVVTTGLSKWCGAGGWRLGIAHVAPGLGGDYLQRVIGICSETVSCAPTPVQHAALAAYSPAAEIDGFLSYQRDVLATLGQHCARQLQDCGVRVHAPEGGFYLFPDFSSFRDALHARGISNSEQLTVALLAEAGVSLLPGSACGMPADSLTARLAYVDFDGGSGPEDGPCDTRRVAEGMDRLCAWLQSCP